MTLVIIAAGMGSRYGGLKQVDPITKDGEFILDFSVYDAIKEGFGKVVFVIKKENEQIFRETVGRRIEKYIKTEYVYQELNDLPEGYSVPEGREKPWGTGHAVLAARDCIDENFAVINADDFYGRDAFEKLASHLNNAVCENGKEHCCMVGYVLRNTLTENGSVSRGQCYIGSDGMLEKITERKEIITSKCSAKFKENDKWYPIPYETTVSMNCFGFTPGVIPKMQESFAEFLKVSGQTMKDEYYLPGAVFKMIENGTADVRVYKTNASWFGVTYSEDKESVVASINKLIENGEYPDGLWK